jgi:hypothetical protein
MLTSLQVRQKQPTAPAAAAPAGDQYSAVELLDILQQSWPGVLRPAGSGTANDPWRPSSPQEWYWIAKKEHRVDAAGQLGSKGATVADYLRGLDAASRGQAEQRLRNRIWLAVGGRLVSINTVNDYAADHGAAPPAAPTPSPTPAASASTPAVPPAAAQVQRFGDDEGPSYPEIYSGLSKTADLHSAAANAKVAAQIRLLLKGASTMAEVNSPTLPLLTVVFFISEVRRNHTAFHTGLMMLDLIEKGVSYDTSGPGQQQGPLTLTWDKVLWHPEVLKLESELETNIAGFRALAKSKDAKVKVEVENLEQVKSGSAGPDGRGKNLSRDARGGEHPMVHQGSITQTSTNLIGDATATMTTARQKEANLLIRWLQHALPKAHAELEAVPAAERIPNVNYKDEAAVTGAKAGKAGAKVEQAALSRTVAAAESFSTFGTFRQANPQLYTPEAIEAANALAGTKLPEKTAGAVTDEKVAQGRALLAESRQANAAKIAALVLRRCSDFDQML